MDTAASSEFRGMTDVILLKQLAENNNPDALSELVGRYQHFVYGVCMRVLDNRSDAEDISNECFIALIRNATNIRTSIGGWLHKAAVGLSIDRIRKNASRRKTEQDYAELRDIEERTSEWYDVAHHIDGLLEQMPEEYRYILMEHYLRRRTEEELAQELGVSPMTMSRRIRAGVEELRERLQKEGVIVSCMVLAGLFTDFAGFPAPATLTATLGKLALAGTGGAGGVAAGGSIAAGAVTATTLSGGLIMKIAAGLVVAAAIAGSAVMMTKGEKDASRPEILEYLKKQSWYVGGVGNKVPPGPEIVKWEDEWAKSRIYEARIGQARHEILFLKTLDALNLSREQMEKIIPLARKAHECQARLASQYNDRFGGVILGRWTEFWVDHSSGDLIEKPRDRKLWNTYDARLQEYAWYDCCEWYTRCNLDKSGDKKAIIDLAGQMENLLTAEQRKILSKEATGEIAAVRDAFMGHPFHQLPAFYLGDLYQGFPSSLRDFFGVSVYCGFLIAPGSAGHLEKKLGREPSDKDLMQKETWNREYSWYLIKRHCRMLAGEFMPVQFLRGCRFTPKQLDEIVAVQKDCLPMHLGAETEYAGKAQALASVTARKRDLLSQGQTVPPALANEEAALNKEVARGPWDGAMGPGYKPPATMPRNAYVWQYNCNQMQKALDRVNKVLTEAQKVAICNAQVCYYPQPWNNQPVNVGSPPVQVAENEDLTKMRSLPEDKYTAARTAWIEKVMQRYNELGKTWHKEYLNPGKPEAKREQLARIADGVRAMTDMGYQLNKGTFGGDLADRDTSSLDGKYSFGQWGNLYNQEYTIPDWKNKTVVQEFEDKIALLTSPMMISTCESRILAGKETRSNMRTASTPLDKLPAADTPEEFLSDKAGGTEKR